METEKPFFWVVGDWFVGVVDVVVVWVWVWVWGVWLIGCKNYLRVEEEHVHRGPRPGQRRLAVPHPDACGACVRGF